ncbi:MAG: hypothetical protein ACYTFY_14745 [Planctomycetota bacterium]|jgi:hypothetical protein
MTDIFWGVVIIGIGLTMGGSVFLGEFSVFNVIFDGLGVYWILRGIGKLMNNEEANNQEVVGTSEQIPDDEGESENENNGQ